MLPQSQNSDPRLAAARFDYEYLGKTVEDIATTYSLSVGVVTAAKASGKWERLVEADKLVPTDATSLENLAEKLATTAKSRLTIIALMRQVELAPWMNELEKQLVMKSVEAVQALTPEDEDMVRKLKQLTSVLNELKGSNFNPLVEAIANATDGKVVVQIQNNLSS